MSFSCWPLYNRTHSRLKSVAVTDGRMQQQQQLQQKLENKGMSCKHAFVTTKSTTLDNALDNVPENIMNQIFHAGGYLTALEVYHFVLDCTNESLKQKLEQDDSLWKKLLLEECLPGTNFHDFDLHMNNWYNYQTELKNVLLSSCKTTERHQNNEQQKKDCQDHIIKWIAYYTRRVANAHSWYKHLPFDVGLVQFDFALDLSSRMRKVNNMYIPYKDDDGTKFHYTWCTTEQYRQKFGYFQYNPIDHRRNPQETSTKEVFWNGKDGIKAETVYVPKSYRITPVDVSCAVHDYEPLSAGSNIYVTILNIMKNNNINDINREAFNELMKKLSVESVRDLTKIGHTLHCNAVLPDITSLNRLKNNIICNLRHDTQNTCGNNTVNISKLNVPVVAEVHYWADIAREAQRERERFAIVKALYELCLKTYGQDITPPWEAVLDYYYSSNHYTN